MKASDLTYDKSTSFLLKGTYGFGKTLAAASFAVEGPIYLAYWDKKKPIELLSYFSRFGDKGKKILANIEYDIYGSSNANEYLNKLIKLSQDCRYFAVITDSVTNLTAGAVNWSLGFRDPKGGKRDPKNKDSPALIPDFDEYKVETSLVSQALDISRTLPAHIIWIAHPLPTMKVEGSGASMKITKSNSIVTYGSKVAGIIPGNFSEIYNFSKRTSWDTSAGGSAERYIVDIRAVGDEYAKTNMFDESVRELDITNQLFYEVWKDALTKQTTRTNELSKENLLVIDKVSDSTEPTINNPWKV